MMWVFDNKLDVLYFHQEIYHYLHIHLYLYHYVYHVDVSKLIRQSVFFHQLGHLYLHLYPFFYLHVYHVGVCKCPYQDVFSSSELPLADILPFRGKREFIFVGEWIIIGAPLETCRAYQLYKVLPSGLISNIHSIDFLRWDLKTNWGWSFENWKAWRSEFDILAGYICPPGSVVDKSILQKSTEDKEDTHPGPHVDGFRIGHRGQWVLDAGLVGE